MQKTKTQKHTYIDTYPVFGFRRLVFVDNIIYEYWYWKMHENENNDTMWQTQEERKIMLMLGAHTR